MSREHHACVAFPALSRVEALSITKSNFCTPDLPVEPRLGGQTLEFAAESAESDEAESDEAVEPASQSSPLKMSTILVGTAGSPRESLQPS